MRSSASTAASTTWTSVRDELCEMIYTDLFGRFSTAKAEFRNSLIAVLSTSISGIVLMAGLLRFFYGWVFQPDPRPASRRPPRRPAAISRTRSS